MWLKTGNDSFTVRSAGGLSKMIIAKQTTTLTPWNFAVILLIQYHQNPQALYLSSLRRGHLCDHRPSRTWQRFLTQSTQIDKHPPSPPLNFVLLFSHPCLKFTLLYFNTTPPLPLCFPPFLEIGVIVDTHDWYKCQTLRITDTYLQILYLCFRVVSEYLRGNDSHVV